MRIKYFCHRKIKFIIFDEKFEQLDFYLMFNIQTINKFVFEA